jgi:DNA-binding PadR family transcriptional regulator
MTLSRSADPSPTAKWVLRELHLADRPLSPGQIQERTATPVSDAIPESTLHDALDRLENEGLVEKYQDRGGDARRTRYRLLRDS